MSAIQLRPSKASSVPKLTTREFLWRPRPLESSFDTSLSPRLEELGDLDPLHADLVRLGICVYLADRTSPRPRRGWERELELDVGVSDPDPWSQEAAPLEDLLAFLTGDVWTLTFTKRRFNKGNTKPADPESTGAVCLFSGGADSAAGAIVLGQGSPPTLVSQRDWVISAGYQNRVRDLLSARWATTPEHVIAWIGRRKHQLGTDQEFPKEGSSRSRSLLFIALGLAAASQRGGHLMVAENGYASLNIPLGGERRGALSTRTTHPAFLDGLEAVLRDMGLTTSIQTPFESQTKGEVFTDVKKLIGPKNASDILSASYSCGKPVARWWEQPAKLHCGICFGCLVRRAAFISSGLTDQTTYVDQALKGTKRSDYLEHQGETYWALQNAITRGIDEEDVLESDLPDRIQIADAVDLGRRGLKELAAVRI
jgi:7-cyano-7-deazaguanine synthase in queuosine biosynthesis